MDFESQRFCLLQVFIGLGIFFLIKRDDCEIVISLSITGIDFDDLFVMKG
jgi:hypothetical protein